MWSADFIEMIKMNVRGVFKKIMVVYLFYLKTTIIRNVYERRLMKNPYIGKIN